MKIENIQFKTLYEDAKKSKSIPNSKWVPKTSPEFLNHILPVLASMPLFKNEHGFYDADSMMLNLKTCGNVKTPNGTINGINIWHLVGFLYYANRGQLIKESFKNASQTKAPRLASLTPLVLFAHKLYNEIPYGDWSKKGNMIKIFLGEPLNHILRVDKDPKLTMDQVIEYRKQALTPLAEGSSMAALTAYKFNIKELNNIDFTYQITTSTGKPRTVKNIPALAMYLQTWLANVEIRDTESMILDPIVWDNIPESYDSIAPKAAEPPTAQLEPGFLDMDAL